MKAVGFNYKLISFVIIFFLCQFLITPVLVFAQSYQLPSDYVQKQEAAYQKTVDKFIQSQNNTKAPISTPSPTPNPYSTYAAGYTPHNKTDSQLLNLLKYVNGSKSVTLKMLLLGFFLGFPDPFRLFSTQARLNMYNFLIAHLPFVSQTIPLPILLPALVFGPLGILLILGICLLLLYKIIRHFLIPIVIPIVATVISSFLLALSKGKSPTKAKTTAPKYSFLELTFPHDTGKSAFATEQLYKLLHALSRQGTFMQGLLKQKKTYSLEIVANRDDGIRFFIVVPEDKTEIIHRNLLSFLPGLKVKEIPDYLESTKRLQRVFNGSNENKESVDDKPAVGVAELTLAKHFALPLQNQKILEEHDSISFLTGNMTKLAPGELISFQLVATPVISDIHRSEERKMEVLQDRIYKGLPLMPVLKGGLGITPPSILLAILSPLAYIVVFGLKVLISIPASLLDSTGKSVPILQSTAKPDLRQILNPYEQELAVAVKEKISQNLFETSLRLLIVADTKKEVNNRASGLVASFGQFNSQYQAFTTRGMFPKALHLGKRLNQFKERSIAGGIFHQNPILSTSEVSDLYHFPYTDITKVEGLVKSKSNNLPAPLSFKKASMNLDVIVGKNIYGGEETPIGQTLEQRRRHTYIIGKTGMGKTEMLKNIIYQDMLNDKGLCVLDPHGDLIQDLLRIIPKNRRKDVIYFNPGDREWPIGLNILSPGITFSNKEEEEERITSSIIAIFQKLTPEEYWGPRMEHILRNATLTALQTPIPSLWVLQQLLTDKDYQRKVAEKLTDPILKQFWEKEFANVGTMQMFAVTEPLTERLGFFITTKMSRHILLQEDSTISIQKIMDSGKIFLVNLSKGDLGEDQSFFFGAMITSLIWMAAYQRTKIPETERADFFLFVDEFQNFATKRFAEISSESRKFHVSLTSSHQNIAQIENPNILKIVAGNADSFIAMKAGPDDEKFILPFMEPEVEKGSIVNLPPYKFFMKVTNEDSEDAFSGETKLLDIKGSDKVAKEVIEYSRKHYATPRKVVEQYLDKLFGVVKKGKKTNTIEINNQKGNNKSIKTETVMAKKPVRRK